MEHIFEWLAREWPHRHPAPDEPTIAEDGMSLQQIANDLKEHVGSADAWLQKVIAEHVPAILAVAEKYQSSPVIQAMELAVFPPEVEAQIAGIITTLARQFPAPAPAQDPAPQQQ